MKKIFLLVLLLPLLVNAQKHVSKKTVPTFSSSTVSPVPFFGKYIWDLANGDKDTVLPTGKPYRILLDISGSEAVMYTDLTMNRTVFGKKSAARTEDAIEVVLQSPPEMEYFTVRMQNTALVLVNKNSRHTFKLKSENREVVKLTDTKANRVFTITKDFSPPSEISPVN